MLKKLFLALAVMGLLGIAAGTASAQGYGGHYHHHYRPRCGYSPYTNYGGSHYSFRVPAPSYGYGYGYRGYRGYSGYGGYGGYGYGRSGLSFSIRF